MYFTRLLKAAEVHESYRPIGFLDLVQYALQRLFLAKMADFLKLALHQKDTGQMFVGLWITHNDRVVRDRRVAAFRTPPNADQAHTDHQLVRVDVDVDLVELSSRSSRGRRRWRS